MIDRRGRRSAEELQDYRKPSLITSTFFALENTTAQKQSHKWHDEMLSKGPKNSLIGLLPTVVVGPGLGAVIGGPIGAVIGGVVGGLVRTVQKELEDEQYLVLNPFRHPRPSSSSQFPEDDVKFFAMALQPCRFCGSRRAGGWRLATTRNAAMPKLSPNIDLF